MSQYRNYRTTESPNSRGREFRHSRIHGVRDSGILGPQTCSSPDVASSDISHPVFQNIRFPDLAVGIIPKFDVARAFEYPDSRVLEYWNYGDLEPQNWRRPERGRLLFGATRIPDSRTSESPECMNSGITESWESGSLDLFFSANPGISKLL